MDQECNQEEENEEEIDEDTENSQILQLMAKYSQLKDLLYAHHVTGNQYVFLSYCAFPLLCTHKILTSVFHIVVIRWVHPRKDSPRQRCLYFTVNSLQ